MKKIAVTSFIVLAIAMFAVESFAAQVSGKSAAKQFGAPALSRADFNRIAAGQGLPFFWTSDKNNSGTIEPGELLPAGAGNHLSEYVSGGSFTEKFKDAYLKMVDARRREAVAAELNFGAPRILASDFKNASAADKKFVEHMVKVGAIIDELYDTQKGAQKYLGDVSKSGGADLALYRRNRGPWCAAPKTENDPFCSALASFPPKLSDAYPEGMAQDEAMCNRLKSMPNGKELLDPFKVVRKEGGKLVALPITAVYGEKMKAVASELKTAAADLGADEPKLKEYLLAAAKGFETNDWLAADEAWVAMNSRNSKWYLRVAPDETYFDPCQEKAGFQVSFAKIDTKSVGWQDKLNAVRNEMEENLAKLIGEPYKARKLSFNFPDFIEIVLNSGDATHNLGAVIGESLPNWGKVAEEGRGRTVVMTNFYTDADSLKSSREKAASLLDASSMKYYTDSKEPSLLATILHEATHNFGPYSDYKINGKNPSEVFGGRTASVLEELKSQTGAMWYVDFLRKKGLISEQMAREIYTSNIVWCFGHISRGMFSADGNPKAYSQLAAVHIGFLSQEGALSWTTVDDPITKEKVEVFQINFDKMAAASEKLMQKAGRIKATGDVAGAKALLDEYITGAGAKYVHAKDIEARLLKFPKETFYYSVVY